MNDDNFVNDPIFNRLREFAATDDAARTMPSDLRAGFRSGIKIAKKRRYAWRGALGAGLMIITFPTLAVAKILPHPIQHFVESVNRVISSPVHKLIELGTAKNVITQNRDIKSAKKNTNGLQNFTSTLSPSEAPTQKSDPSEQGILSSLGKATESGKPHISVNEGAGNAGVNKSEKKGDANPATSNQNADGTENINPSTDLPSLSDSNNPVQSPEKSPSSHDPRGGVDKGITHKPSK